MAAILSRPQCIKTKAIVFHEYHPIKQRRRHQNKDNTTDQDIISAKIYKHPFSISTNWGRVMYIYIRQ